MNNKEKVIKGLPSSEYKKQWRQANKEHVREYLNAWLAKHNEKRKVYRDNMEKNHPGYFKLYQRKRRAAVKLKEVEHAKENYVDESESQQGCA